MLNVFKNKFSQIHKQSKEAKELLRFIGPGILVTVGFIDPGNWAANLAGLFITKYGYRKGVVFGLLRYGTDY